MKTKILLKMGLIAMCFMAGFVEMEAQELFQKEYGYNNSNSSIRRRLPSTIQQTYDSGFVSLNRFMAVIGGRYSAASMLLKTSKNGSAEWSQAWIPNNLSDLYPNAVIQTADSGFCVAGFANLTKTTAPFLFKTDKTGNKLWFKIYGDTAKSNGTFRSITDGNDGSLYIVGRDSILLKTDNNGNVLWTKKYSENYSVIRQTNDGNFVVSGTGLAKIDTAGNIFWAKKYSESGALYVRPLQNGGYLLSGGNRVLKADSTGNIVWANIYSGTFSQYTTGIDELYSGRYIVAGIAEPGLDAFEGFYMILDSSGSILTAKYPIKKEHMIFSVARTQDSGFVAEVGYGYFGGAAALLKADKNGLTSCPEKERIQNFISRIDTVNTTIPTITDTLITITATDLPCEFLSVVVTATDICAPTDILEENETGDFQLYPNPASRVCTILLKENIQNADVAIMDVNGKTLYRKFLKNAEGEIMLDISPLQPGAYFIKVIADGREFIQKMIVE